MPPLPSHQQQQPANDGRSGGGRRRRRRHGGGAGHASSSPHKPIQQEQAGRHRTSRRLTEQAEGNFRQWLGLAPELPAEAVLQAAMSRVRAESQQRLARERGEAKAHFSRHGNGQGRHSPHRRRGPGRAGAGTQSSPASDVVAEELVAGVFSQLPES